MNKWTLGRHRSRLESVLSVIEHEMAALEALPDACLADVPQTMARLRAEKVCAIAVLASSATAKKVPPPPPTTTGVFALGINDSITFSNMTITSDDQVVAGACLYVFGQQFSCGEIGVNTPGKTVTLADVSFSNEFGLPIEVRLLLLDGSTSTQYFSDGTLLSEGVLQPVSHATVFSPAG